MDYYLDACMVYRKLFIRNVLYSLLFSNVTINCDMKSLFRKLSH